MEFTFDHLVYLTRKPEDVVSPLNSIGLHVVEGGRHEKWGSYNSLSYFGLSYIEFLGIDNWAIAENEIENRLILQAVDKLRKDEEGPMRIALRTNSIHKVAERMKVQGIKVFGPFPGERTKKDGNTIKWSLLFPENSHESELEYPFFIQWEQSDEERLQELKNNHFIGLHTIGNGDPTFEYVGFAVNDLTKSVKQWGQLFGLKSSEVFMDETLKAKCQRLIVSGTELLFCEPAGDGIVKDNLKSRGEAPFLIHLSQTGKSEFIKKVNGLWEFQ